MKIEDNSDDRRCKLVAISAHKTFDLMLGTSGNQCLEIPELPEEYYVMASKYNFRTNAFEFKICSASFKEVREGAEYPYMDVILHVDEEQKEDYQ